MKKRTRAFISLAMTVCLTLSNSMLATASETNDTNNKTLLTQEDLDSALHEEGLTRSFERASVHDPSIVTTTDKDGKTLYYVFGTHMAVAKSYDLTNWEQVYDGYKKDSPLFGTINEKGETVPISFDTAFENNAYTGTVTTNIDGSLSQTEFGYYNAKAWHTALDNYHVDGNLWAPDVIYNKKMQKWTMYMSLNGSQSNSVIVLLTADDIEGPYVYQGPVVYSGFYNSSEAISYMNTDLELVYGTLNSLPEKYNLADRNAWGNYWPHAIDPCVYYDENGNLRMTYGSWSGGIYELMLDETTGLRDYSVTYEDVQSGQNITSDKYFGTHLAGGYYVSGEASYIKFINGRYYLFVTNGDLGADGNYQMRVFSSDNPDGPFLDTKGESAIYDSYKINYNSNYGHIYSGTDNGAEGSTAGARLMTNYKWNFMDAGEVSQGHNSVLVNDDGAFVIYHTRFDNGIDGHELRVHQLYTVSNGSLVAAPCEYDALLKDKASYTKEETGGSYDVIFGKYDTNPHWVGGKKSDGGSLMYAGTTDCETPIQLTLAPDGTVMSDDARLGSWSLADDGKYATVTINDAIDDEHLAGTYQCIFIEQNTSGKQTTCFTGINEASGISIWGCANEISDTRAVALTDLNLLNTIPERTSSKLSLPTTGISGSTITWSSNAPEIISSTGVVKKAVQDTKVTLTATISKGDVYFVEKIPVIVTVQDISMGNMTVKLPSANFTCEMDNPFYGQTIDQLYIHYTITLDKASKLDGLADILRFYNSQSKEKGESLSLLSAPYLTYQTSDGTSIDFHKPSDTQSAGLSADTPVTCEILIDRKTNNITFTTNGTKVVFYEEDIAQKGITTATLLDSISKNCDTFSWGSATNTEIGTLEDVIITDTAPVNQTFTEDSYQITPDFEPVVMANAFDGEDISLAELEYTVSYEGESIDSYAGLFAFYPTDVSGRISFHTMPYICYNDGSSNWIDIKPSTASDTITGNSTYTYKYILTKDKLRLYVNNERVFTSENSSGATYENLLNYMSKCAYLSMGVNADTSFWYNNSKVTAEISNLHFGINAVSKVHPPYVTISVKDDNGSDTKPDPPTNPDADKNNQLGKDPNTDSGNSNSNTNSNTSTNDTGNNNNTPNNISDSKNQSDTPAGSQKVSVKKVTLKSVKNKKGRKALVNWKKVSNASGYAIQYSTSKKFKKPVTVKVKKAKTTSTTLKKLKKRKTYYVRVRAYKTVNGTTYYGKYSSVKKVRIKK